MSPVDKIVVPMFRLFSERMKETFVRRGDNPVEPSLRREPPKPRSDKRSWRTGGGHGDYSGLNTWRR